MEASIAVGARGLGVTELFIDAILGYSQANPRAAGTADST
jgi:hypothetical protein